MLKKKNPIPKAIHCNSCLCGYILACLLVSPMFTVFILSLNSRDYRFMLTNHLSEADVEPLPVEPSPDHHFSTLPAPALSSSGLIPSDRG